MGFLREYLKSNYASQLHNIMDSHEEEERERLRPFLEDCRNASVEEMVKRSHLTRIVAAWIITVPASAFMAAILFFTLRGFLM